MDSEMIIGLIATVVMVYSIYLIATKNKKIERRKEIIKDNTYSVTCKHVVGLPVAEGAMCTITYSNDSIDIKQGNNNFKIGLEKVADVTTTTDTEIQKHYVSSVGGAIAGGVMFGPLGAIVGGRAKEKKSKTITHYLCVTYNSDGEIKYISFEYVPSANSVNFVAKFNTSKTQNSIIEL